MSIRWQFLTEEEQKKFDEYDIALVSLLEKRANNYYNEEIEEQIKKLHLSMDLFILKLEQKYCNSSELPLPQEQRLLK